MLMAKASYPEGMTFPSYSLNSNFGEAPPPYSVGTDHCSSIGVHSPGFIYPCARVELRISCRNLLDLDVFSRSDPMVVLYMQSKTEPEKWQEIGRTEIISESLSPDFVKSFILDYYFEERQALKFEVYDVDNESQKLSQQDFIGGLVCSLGQILGEGGGKFERSLQNPKYKESPGSIIVTAEEVGTCKDYVVLSLAGRNLDKKDFFGKSDPFLEIERCNEDGSFSVVHRTEVIKVTLNPTWQPFTIPASTLCNGDFHRTLRMKCYDWNSNGRHSLIGSFKTCLNALSGSSSGNPSGLSSYDLINEEKAKKSKYKNSGTINVVNCTVFQKATFLDFIRGGTELAFVVAIDFTASNGNPALPESLHYFQAGQMSPYVQALRAIGTIIEDYDTDKLFPAFGFGGKLPPAFQVSHEFPLNFNYQNPNCQGMNGIIGAYYHSLRNVQLSGPTCFAPIINGTARIASDNARLSHGQQYFVLLIITDGQINDMEVTKEAIVNAARLPMSIIIVGVGDADFSGMEELDGDNVRLCHRGVQAERDIVQFVPFRNYLDRGQYSDMSGPRLAKDVLQELPDQLVEYMEKKHIKPGRAG